MVKTQKSEQSEETIENTLNILGLCETGDFLILYDTIILDEINNMIDYGLLNVEDVILVLKERPKKITYNSHRA